MQTGNENLPICLQIRHQSRASAMSTSTRASAAEADLDISVDEHSCAADLCAFAGRAAVCHRSRAMQASRSGASRNCDVNDDECLSRCSQRGRHSTVRLPACVCSCICTADWADETVPHCNVGDSASNLHTNDAICTEAGADSDNPVDEHCCTCVAGFVNR